MKNQKNSKVSVALNRMNKDDIYSMMLFTLYKLKDLPDCLALTDLCYLLDGENLTRLLSYYGGMTITLPTLRDLRLVLQSLYLYQYVNFEKGEFEDGLKAVVDEDLSADEIKTVYAKIVEVLANYEFERTESR